MFTVQGCGTVPEINPCTWKLFKKLLRVLQEGEFERVGEDVTRKVDVRVIAATNQNLAEQVRARQFREDLFYRLNVLPLALPPLRARPDDIPLLAAHAIEDVSKRLRIQAPSLTQADVARLRQYDWPGNVRELERTSARGYPVQRCSAPWAIESLVRRGRRRLRPRTPASGGCSRGTDRRGPRGSTLLAR